MNTDIPRRETLTAMDIVHRLRDLTRPLARVGSPIRWQSALSKAAEADGKNPALADIMDLVLLSIEDVNAPTAMVSRAEVHMHGKTIARFSFPVIQLCLVAKVASLWGPDGPEGRDDVSGEDMRDAMLSVFRRYHQEHVFTMIVEEYEAKLIGDGMIPEEARRLSHAIVSTLAGPREAGTIDRKKRLDQHLTEGRTE